jgi:thioredoxin-like negative regulator of GroEL
MRFFAARTAGGLIALLAASCAPRQEAAPPSASPSATSAGSLRPTAPPAAAPVPAAPLSPIAFIEDDIAAATAEARAASKALFVDAWAPWCHTCLSMKGYVFKDLALAPLAARVVFAAIDTDREVNARFLERYAVDVWPTFFVIEPESGRLVGHWTGAASVRELRTFVEDSLDAFDAVRRGAVARESPASRLLEAKNAQADGRYGEAAELFRQALESAPSDWPRRSEALLGRLQALHRTGRHLDCVKFGQQHASEVQGAARPADFCYYLLSCARHVADPKLARRARDAAVDRLRAVTARPSPEMSVDDRADALATLAGALRARGDRDGARAMDEARLALMERAARDAPSPAIAATYDYARAEAYVALGRADEAVQMLMQRQRELPDAYDPPGRLAGLLASLGRPREALAAVERALELSYGRRRLRYLALKAQILGALGDHAGRVAALEAELTGWKALPSGQVRKHDLRDAEQRLAAARRARAAR